MTTTIHDLLAPAGLRATLFPATSRYHGIDVAFLEREDGTAVAYLRRRFLPQPERLATVREHTVVAGNFVAAYPEPTVQQVLKALARQKAFQQVLDSSGAEEAPQHPALKPLLELAAD